MSRWNRVSYTIAAYSSDLRNQIINVIERSVGIIGEITGLFGAQDLFIGRLLRQKRGCGNSATRTLARTKTISLFFRRRKIELELLEHSSSRSPHQILSREVTQIAEGHRDATRDWALACVRKN